MSSNGEQVMRRMVRSMTIAGLALLTMASLAWAAPNQYRVQVNGLSCPFCAYGIEKKFSQVNGVDKIATNIAKGTVSITMKEGATLDRATAAKAVKDAGFALGGFEEVKGTVRK